MRVPAYGSTVLCSLVLLLGCRPRQPAGQEQPGPESADASRSGADAVEELSGRVFVTGSEPGVSVTLTPARGSSVRLLGSLRSELARLSGAAVRVRGALGGGAPSRALEVESYDLLEVDGEVPSVGTLMATKDGGLRLAGRDTVELVSPPEALRRQDGAKVWIVGRPSSGKLAVQSYGIIREAGER